MSTTVTSARTHAPALFLDEVDQRVGQEQAHADGRGEDRHHRPVHLAGFVQPLLCPHHLPVQPAVAKQRRHHQHQGHKSRFDSAAHTPRG